MTESIKFDRAAFDKLVNTITKSGAAYAKAIGAACLQAVYFSIVEQDAGPANALLTSMRKSTKQAAVQALLAENGNLVWCERKGKDASHFKHYDAQQVWGIPEDIKALREACANWESYKAVKVKEDVDAQKALDALIKRLEKAREDKCLIDTGLLAKLKDLSAAHNAAVIDAILGV